MNQKQKREETKSYLEKKISQKPKVAIVLGSGLGDFVDLINDAISIPYSEIPHFGQTSVEGHSGQLVFGTIGSLPVVAMQGRLHAYEGHSLEDVVFPLRALTLLGIKKVILTNASGGISSNYRAGDIVMITDHINLTGKNPLVGPNDPALGARFPDMGDTYARSLRKIFSEAAKAVSVDLKEGIYAGVMGPTYETPAEVRMLRTLGADLVGMSTVPEAIACHHMGVKVAGLACITNLAAGLTNEELRHEDIKDVAQKARAAFTNLLLKALELMAKES
jgi:purine-nucleoside phosphorylase